MRSIRPFNSGKNSKNKKNMRLFDSSLGNFKTGKLEIQKLNFTSTSSSGAFLPPKSLDKFKTSRGFSSTREQVFESYNKTPKQQPVVFTKLVQDEVVIDQRQLKVKIQANAMQRFQDLFKKQTSLRAKKIQDEQNKRLLSLLQMRNSRVNRFKSTVDDSKGKMSMNESSQNFAQAKESIKSRQTINDAGLNRQENIMAQKQGYLQRKRTIEQEKQQRQVLDKFRDQLQRQTINKNREQSHKQNNVRKSSKFFRSESNQNVKQTLETVSKGQVIKQKKVELNKKNSFEYQLDFGSQMSESNDSNVKRASISVQMNNDQTYVNKNVSDGKVKQKIEKKQSQYADNKGKTTKEQISFKQSNNGNVVSDKMSKSSKQNDASNDEEQMSQMHEKSNITSKMSSINNLFDKPQFSNKQENSRKDIVNNVNDSRKRIEFEQMDKKRVSIKDVSKRTLDEEIDLQNIKGLPDKVIERKNNKQETSKQLSNQLTGANKKNDQSNPNNQSNSSNRASITIKTSKQVKTFKQSSSNRNMPKPSSQQDEQLEQLDQVKINSKPKQSNSLKPNNDASKPINDSSKQNNNNVRGNRDSEQASKNDKSVTSLSGKLNQSQPQNRNSTKNMLNNSTDRAMNSSNGTNGNKNTTTLNPPSRPVFSLNLSPQKPMNPPQKPQSRVQFNASDSGQQQNDPVSEVFYLICLVETLGGYNNKSKQFYSTADSSMVEIVMNHRLASYFISQQFYYYLSIFLEYLEQNKKGKFYSLQPQQLLQALEDQQVKESVTELRSNLQITPKLIKHTYEKSKVYLSKQDKQLSISTANNYHGKCVHYLKQQFTLLYNIYQNNQKNAVISQRLCYLIQVYGILMALTGEEIKEFQELQDIGKDNYHRHVQTYKAHLLQ